MNKEYKTLQQFIDECTWCNEGYRCLECNGCRQQFDEQFRKENMYGD